MQALVGDEMRESPYLVLRVPPSFKEDGGMSFAKAETPVVRRAGHTLGLKRDACQSPCLMVQHIAVLASKVTVARPGVGSQKGTR